jgi:hypothetical protein
MTKKTRNWLIALSILAFPFVLFFGCLIFMEEPLPPVAPLPNPNGYDDLVKAGQMLAYNTGSYDWKNVDEVQRVVSANAPALVIARTALSNQCQVPVQFTAAFNSNHVNDLAPIKFLGRAFIAEGQLAEMENRPADAAESYLDAIHLANESARGGLLIDQLVGESIEEYATSLLQKLVQNLDAKTCREVAATLENLDAQRPTWNEVMQQERAWSYRTFFGWHQEFSRLIDHYKMKQTYEKLDSRLKEKHLATRQLIIDLAVRAYELDNGKPPSSVADLVPDYLKAVPQDPSSGKEMNYLPR